MKKQEKKFLLDRGLIEVRLDVIERNLKEIESIVKEGEEKFLRDYRSQLAAKHALLECIEACVDIANHFISSLRFRRPEDYRDVFVILEENKIIPSSLSERLQRMVGFRNLLVHRYTKIDIKRVFEIMKKDAKDIVEFVKVILKFLKSKV
jgi:uncharacterized protein YutE (UPF0331/DUF86 family)